MSEKILAILVQFVTHVIDAGGYAGIASLMGIESACIPLPSEIIMPFAGYVVYLGHLNLFWVATAGAVGCNLGSLVAYWIGATGGRPLVERYGRLVRMSHHDDWNLGRCNPEPFFQFSVASGYTARYFRCFW